MGVALFIFASTLSAFLVRLLGVYLMPRRKGSKQKHDIPRELMRLAIASLAAWVTYVVVPEERSFTIAVVIGTFVGTFLSFATRD